MFKLQARDHNGRWKDVRFAPRFETAEAAMAHAARYDEDGYVPEGMYRAVAIEKRVTVDAIFANPKGWM